MVKKEKMKSEPPPPESEGDSEEGSCGRFLRALENLQNLEELTCHLTHSDLFAFADALGDTGTANPKLRAVAISLERGRDEPPAGMCEREVVEVLAVRARVGRPLRTLRVQAVRTAEEQWEGWEEWAAGVREAFDRVNITEYVGKFEFVGSDGDIWGTGPREEEWWAEAEERYWSCEWLK